jgi:phage anti-repressor protein/phage antirepressor YoqD-like protein
MNELIKITNHGDRQTTSARDLWEFLGKPYTKFTMWFNQYKEYGFIENVDYGELSVKTYTSQGAEHDAIDYEITLDMAKELAMLQKSEKGKQARRYFIEAEKRYRATLPDIETMLANPDTIIRLATTLKEERQKRLEAEQTNTILMHVNKTYTATEIAKEIGFKSATALNRDLGKKRVQYKQNDTWVLYSNHANRGYTEIKQEVLDNGKVIYHRRWTQLGRKFLLDLYREEVAI